MSISRFVSLSKPALPFSFFITSHCSDGVLSVLYTVQCCIPLALNYFIPLWKLTTTFLFTHIEIAATKFFPPQHPDLPPTSSSTPHPLAMKWPSFHGNPIHQHIIPLSELKRGSISDDVIASRETLKSRFRLPESSQSQPVCV